MPSKRTRSTTVEQPDGNNSNVTDYMGPPAIKRPKNNAQSAKTSTRVTRAAQAAILSAEQPQSRATSTRHNTRLHDFEEDDDDGSIHVAFNKVSSAVNEARFGRTRASKGLQPQGHQAVPNRVTEDEADEDEAIQPISKRGRPVDKKQSKQQGPSKNQQTGRKSQSRAEVVGLTIDEHTPRREMPSRENKALAQRNSSGRSAPKKRPKQQQMAKQSAVPDKDDQQDNEELASEDEEGEEDGQGTVTQIAEDSVFIDAPRPHEKLPEVKRTVNNLRGMIQTLSHPAWTGRKHWDEDPDMACSTKTAGQLIDRLRQLNDLLLASSEARYEGDADGDPEVTIDFLRGSSGKFKGLLAEITSLVDCICTQKLAAAERVGTRGINNRKRFLRDITKRLMPMLVLVLQKAYDVGRSEERGGVVHLTLNSFTIQFPLRTIGWAIRLMETLSRGLLLWPIDDEFDQSDEELDIADVARKQAKTSKREMFHKHLVSLYSSIKKAADALERQAKETERKTRREQDRRRALLEEEQYRRQAMIRGRELWARDERQRQEAERKANMQMEKFVQATQALKAMPDPLAVLWQEANVSRHPPATSQASVSNSPVSLQQPIQGTARAPPIEDDMVDERSGPSGRRVQIGLVSSNHRPQNGVPRTINGLRAARALEAWGVPRWSKAEEKRLVFGIKFDKSYNPSTFAPRLGRSIEDVARKAAELKAVYREIYTNRGDDIPAWAW